MQLHFQTTKGLVTETKLPTVSRHYYRHVFKRKRAFLFCFFNPTNKIKQYVKSLLFIYASSAARMTSSTKSKPISTNNNNLLLLLLLYILLFSNSLPRTQSSDDRIEQICKKTPFYDLCKSSLNPQNPTLDIKTVASTMANLVLSNATDTLNYIQELLKEGADPELQKPLANCAELYIPVVKYNLPQAINALLRRRFGFTSYLLSDARKQAEDCEKNFSGSSNSSPLTQRNKLLANLCDVAVAILKLLQKG